MRYLYVPLTVLFAVAPALLAFQLPPLPNKDGTLPTVTSADNLPSILDEYLQKAGISKGHPAYESAHKFLSFYLRYDEDKGIAGFSPKYYAFATSNLANIGSLLKELDDQPQLYRDSWTRWLSERMVGYRIPYDLPKMREFLGAIPTGELKEGISVAELNSWFNGQFGDLKPVQKAKIAYLLAEINPDLMADGKFRGAAGSDPRWIVSDGDWNHAFQLVERSAILLPPAAWLKQSASEIEADVVQEELIRPEVEFRYYQLVGAGIDDVVLRVELAKDNGAYQVVGATATVPSVHNRQYPVVPLSLNPKDGVTSKPDPTFDQPWLQVIGDRITGSTRILYRMSKQDKVIHTLKLDLPLGAGEGTYVLRKPGKRRAPEVLPAAMAKPIPDPSLEMDAPRGRWGGIFGNTGDGVQRGAKWVSNFEDANLAWVSDLRTPTTRGPNTRGKSRPVEAGMPLSGGWASPVVEEGVVYLPYFKPSGTEYAYNAAVEARKAPTPLEASRWDMMKIKTDEYLHAFDAGSGRTLWQLRLPGRGVNWMAFNKGGPGVTPGVSEGIVVWVGSLGEVYAAKDGKLLWVNDIGLRHEQMVEDRRRLLQSGELFGSRNDFQSQVVIADGVAVISDQMRTKRDYRYEANNGLRGLDLKTGRHLWSLPEVAGRNKNQQGAQIWNINGKEFVISSGINEAFLIEPRTGEVVARQKGLVNSRQGFSIGGDIVVGEDAETGRYTAYRYSQDKGFEFLWQLDESHTHRDGVGVFVDGRFFLPSYKLKTVLCVDAESGDILSQEPAPINGGEHSPFYISDGEYIIGCRDRTAGLLVFQAAADKFAGSTKEFNLSLGTGYCGAVVPALVDGRMFIRSPDRLLAFDLRAAHQQERVNAEKWSHVRNAKEIAAARRVEVEQKKLEKAQQEAKKRHAPKQSKEPREKKRKAGEIDQLLEDLDQDISRTLNP